MLKVIPKNPHLSALVWRRQRPFRNFLACVGSLAVGWTLTATAGDHFYNFDPPNGDPNNTPGFIVYGANKAGSWHTNSGASGSDTDGFLEITPAVNNMNLGVLFPLDYFTNADQSIVALPLKGFLIEADVRIGNAVGNNGRPADGFSISYARSSGQATFNSSDDPVVYWGKQANFRGWAGGDADTQALEPSAFNYATGGGVMDPTICDSSTAENGTKTGVSVQFDTWSGNRILDQNGAAGADNVGWRVHFNGKMLTRLPVTQIPSSPDGSPGDNLNGLAVCPAINATFDQDPSCTALVCADTNTIQTGTYSADSSGDFSNLCWTHFSIELTTNAPHLLTVKFKGRTLVDSLALTNFQPFVGQLVMGGRTGGANENRDIDNVHIVTYPSVQAVFGGLSSASSFINDFSILIQNLGPAKVTSIDVLTLDGVDIKSAPGTTITLADPNNTVKYVPAASFASGSSHTVVITYSDAAGTQSTSTVGFTTLPWFVIPATASVPAASIDTTQPGLRIQSYQTTAGNPNRMYWTDEQLLGLHGTNVIDYQAIGIQLVNGEIQWNDIIDFGNSSGPSGQFPSDRSWDQVGIPALTLLNDNNSAIAASTYLYFPAPGTYIMGGNSDDGLRVTFAQNSHDLLGTQVPGLFADFGRGIGADQNVGAIVVTNAGYYGFRLLWENGGGGSAVEWYFKSTPAGTTNVLINDTLNNPNTAIKAYQVSSAAPPYVSYAEPPLNDDQVAANLTLTYKLTDGATTVNSGSVLLAVNGTTQSPTISSSGGVTSIAQAPPATLWPPGSNYVQLSFKDSANTTYNYAYSFSVLPYATLDPSISTPLGKQDTTQPGFLLNTVQIDFAQVNDAGDGAPNQSDYAIGAIAGLWFPWYGSNAANVANTFGTNVPATSSNLWAWTTPILFNAAGPADSIGDYDRTNYSIVPGIPGNFLASNLGNLENNFAQMIKTWLVFPTAGFFTMDFNSDDGFRVWEGLGPTRQVLHVTGAGIDTDVGSVVSDTAPYGNGGFGAPLTVAGVSAPVMFVSSNNWTLGSSVNLAGKIAVVDENIFGLGNDHLLCYMLQTNGAVGAITINPPGNGFPYVMGGGGSAVTIPCVNVSGFGGQRDFWITNQNLTASIAASQPFIIGEADYGKGRSEVNFYFNVPQAGVYPITVVWYQGGGGAGAEWTSITTDGARHLVGDSTDPNSFLAYRAATVTPPTNPKLSVAKQGNSWVLTYEGTLYSSLTVNGAYGPVAGASSPYTIPAATTIQFYRAHTP